MRETSLCRFRAALRLGIILETWIDLMDLSGEFQSIDRTGHHNVSEYHIKNPGLITTCGRDNFVIDAPENFPDELQNVRFIIDDNDH
jgi:hypothetical protein